MKNDIFTELLKTLKDDDKRVLLLIKAYEDQRRSSGQYGYQAFHSSKNITNTPVFKQFRTVIKWLSSKSWTVTINQVHWQGYVKYVFDYIHPTIPQPGQLKNEKLLSGYVKMIPDVETVGKSVKELEALYKKVLRPELLKDRRTQRLLGLVNINLCPHVKS